MADTIREKIILAAMTQLAKITVANGYQYTMATPVRGKKDIPPGSLPVSVVFPQIEENVQQYAKDNLTFFLRVESLQNLALADNASIIQEKMLGDLRLNMTNPAERWWSTYANSIKYTEGGPTEQPEADAKTTAIYCLFSIEYKTILGKPYNQ